MSTSTIEEASNDQPGLFFSAPGVTFLSCHGYDVSSLNDIDTSTTSIDLAFNYELFTVEGTNVNEAIIEYESGLLGGVAEELGVMDCVGSKSKRMRGTKNPSRGLMAEPKVVGISSLPEDEVSNGECTTKMLDSSNLTPATCTSINGYMSAWLPIHLSSRRVLSESDIIYAAIEKAIAMSYTSETIVGVKSPKIIEHAVVEQSNTVVTSSRENILPNDSPIWQLGPGVGLLAIIVSLTALAGVVHMVKKRKGPTTSANTSSNNNVVSPSIAELEPEIASEITSQPPTPIKSNLSRVNTLGEDDNTDDESSVATEDYTQDNYTRDEYIQRSDTYGSGWGDGTSTWASMRERSLWSMRSLVSEEDEMPSEVGEEIEF